MKIVNQTREAVIAENALWAKSFFSRLRGLLGRPEPQPGEGLIIDPCKSVHMWGMRYSLDVLFSDKDDCVISIEEGLAPWRMSRHVKAATRVVELPVGTIQSSGTR